MYKVVNLLTTEGEKEFPMLANGATAIRFRQVFHQDLMAGIAKFSKLNEDPDSVDFDLPAKMAYIMNAAAESQDMNKLSADGWMKWVEQFEGDTLWNAQDSFTEIYLVNQQVNSKGKK